MRYVIGLTGEIASGKSTVSNILRGKKAFVIDADQLTRGVMKKGGAAYEDIVAYFGKTYLTPEGEIDRRKLGVHVFANKAELQKLEKLTHPHVMALADVLLQQNDGIVVLDVPLLFEANMQHLCNEIWVVTAPEDVRLQRLIDRDGFSEKEASDRIKSREEIKYAGIIPTYWIENTGSLEILHGKVETLWECVEEKWQEKQ